MCSANSRGGPGDGGSGAAAFSAWVRISDNRRSAVRGRLGDFTSSVVTSGNRGLYGQGKAVLLRCVGYDRRLASRRRAGGEECPGAARLFAGLARVRGC